MTNDSSKNNTNINNLYIQFISLEFKENLPVCTGLRREAVAEAEEDTGWEGACSPQTVDIKRHPENED